MSAIKCFHQLKKEKKSHNRQLFDKFSEWELSPQTSDCLEFYDYFSSFKIVYQSVANANN